jgi:single-strand DNA-binding protein
MAFSLNKVCLLGNLGKDPELSYSGSGRAYCRFSIATNYSVKDENDNWQTKTDWHNIVTFGKVAEDCSTRLKKGSKVYIEGRLQYDVFEKDGVKRNSVSIIVSDFSSIIYIDRKESLEPGKGAEGTEPAPSAEDDLPF